MTSNKKKEILKSIGKALAIIGIVALLSYIIISKMEENKKPSNNSNPSAVIVDNNEVIIDKIEESDDSALEYVDVPEPEEEKPVYIAPAKVFDANEWQYYSINGNNVICGYTGEETSVILPLKINGINFTSFDKGAFFYNDKIEKIEIPIGYKEIPEEAFIGCTNLKRVVIPETITKINAHAFRGCESMEELNIPANVEKIDQSALMGLSNIKSITIDENNKTYTVKDNLIFDEKGSRLFKAIITTDTLTLPSDLQKIGSYAISNSEILKNLELPQYLNTIESYGIYECPNIEEINLSASVGTIENYAFYNTKIKTFSVEKRSKYYDAVDGILYNKTKDTIICFPAGMAGEYTLNPSTKYISPGAFVNVELTRLNIPNTIYQIYVNSFIGSKNLTIYSNEKEYDFLAKCHKNWNISFKGKLNCE